MYECPKISNVDFLNFLSTEIQHELLHSHSEGTTRPFKSDILYDNSEIDKCNLRLQNNFVDKEFLATADIIDGRYLKKLKNVNRSNYKVCSTSDEGTVNFTLSNTNEQSKAVMSCLCGVASRLRQVSKDGPNQGRYFATCSLRKCNYFAWGDNYNHSKKSENLIWLRFDKLDGWILKSPQGFSPHDILQGGVGDCWFLSAVAVLAERSDLIQAIVKDKELPSDGRITFCLFLDGHWKDIVVDNILPCIPQVNSSNNMKQKTTTIISTTPINDDNSSDGDVDFAVNDSVKLTYSRSYKRRLWVPLLEKAYAKAHGTYSLYHRVICFRLWSHLCT